MTPEQIQNKPFFYKPFYIPPKADLFAQRALRFQELAQQDNSSWHDYLSIMASLAQAQQHALDQHSRQPETALPRVPNVPTHTIGSLKTLPTAAAP